MRNPFVPLAVRPWLLALLVGILCFSILYSSAVRRALLISDLQFIPVEDELVVVTGDLESLWKGIDDHFGAVFRDEADEAGALTEGFRSLRETFREEEPRVGSLADLVGHGVAVEEGLLMSVDRLGASEPSALLVLPVGRTTALTGFVSGLIDREPHEEPLFPDLPGTEMVSFGTGGIPSGSPNRSGGSSSHANSGRQNEETLLAYPGEGRALLAENRDHLRRSLLYRDRNLAHAWADDGLYRAVRERLRGSLGSGPAVLARWRPLAQPGIREMTGVMTLRPDALRVSIEVQVDAGILRVLDDLLAPVEMKDEWHHYLGPQTAAALVIEDEALSGHLDFLRQFATVRNFMDDRYGGVLSALEKLPGLHRILLAVTGYRDGLPELLMGVWGDPDSLEVLVRDVQLRRREERDRAVLEGALQALVERGDATAEELVAGGGIPLETLEQAGLLVSEVGSTFHRYRIGRVSGGLEPELRVQAVDLAYRDLNTASYLRSYGSQTIRLVLPPITDNDVAYFDGLAEVDGETLRSDRYRMATVLQDSILWIATDVSDAQERIDRAAAKPEDLVADLGEDEAFQLARTMWTKEDRIQGFLDIGRLTTLGLLSPESRVQEMVKALLLDLRHHPSFSFALRPEDSQEHVLLEVAAILQRGRGGR